MTETQSIKIGHDGKIVEQIVGDNTFQLPYMDLVTLSMEWPKETADPQPEIMSASAPPQA